MSKKELELNFNKKINCSQFIELSFDKDELQKQIIEFIWFFNGTNNIKFLLEHNHFDFIELVYKKYCNEIDNLIKYYELKEIIEESDFFHGWFKNWTNLEKFTKHEFLNKIKTDIEFSSIWADFGASDSLELRNWGIQISFDNEDRGRISQKGKDQIRELINSLINDPENGLHVISYMNLINSEYRLLQNNLLFNKFFCELLSYEERIEWLFYNKNEDGLDLQTMLESFKKENLDFLKWNDQTISLPKYKLNIIADYNMISSESEFEKAKIFNYIFLIYICNIFNMVPCDMIINSTYKKRYRVNKNKLIKYNICLEKKDFTNINLDIQEFKINH